jgi:hypothetical protein
MVVKLRRVLTLCSANLERLSLRYSEIHLVHSNATHVFRFLLILLTYTAVIFMNQIALMTGTWQVGMIKRR